MKRKTYWVYLNDKYIAEYRTLRECLDFIERRKLEANYDNDLGIIDNDGNEYNPYTGNMMNEYINEWNMWDGDRRSSYSRQTRLIDVADKMRREQILDRKEKYNNDPEYHEHIKRLKDELRRTDDPQHAEYLERRISKLKSLGEVVKESVGMQNIVIKKYKKDIENFLNDYKWETISPMDVMYEFEYGDEYYTLVDDILNYLEIDESDPEYDDIRYGVGPIIRNHLRKMNIWR